MYRKTARQRLQLHHEEAKKLISQHDLICHEDLNVKGPSQGNLGRQIHDVGWGQFFQILSSKAAEAGRRVSAIDPRFTSQRRRICGHTEWGNRGGQASFRGLSCRHRACGPERSKKHLEHGTGFRGRAYLNGDCVPREAPSRRAGGVHL
nr:zinc ribbon domain-containing protein [Deinococcus sp. DB0503]